MDKTLEKENPLSEENVSNEGGIRLRLRDRDLLKKRKAEAEEKATNQWVSREQSLKRAKNWSSGTPGRKGRPRKQQLEVLSEDLSGVQETDPPSITPPVLPTEATTATPQPAESQPAPVPLFVETIKEKTLDTFFIEDLGPDEEEDVPLSQKRLVIESEIGEQRTDVPEQIQISVPVFAPATAPSYPESLHENVPEHLF